MQTRSGPGRNSSLPYGHKRTLVQNACPFADQIQQHGLLLCVHRGSLEAIGNELLSVLPGSPALGLPPCRSEPLASSGYRPMNAAVRALCRFPVPRAGWLPVQTKESRLSPGQRGCENAPRYRDVHCQMVPTELQHPRFRYGRLAEKRDAIEAAAEHIAAGKGWTPALATRPPLSIRSSGTRRRPSRTSRRRAVAGAQHLASAYRRARLRRPASKKLRCVRRLCFRPTAGSRSRGSLFLLIFDLQRQFSQAWSKLTERLACPVLQCDLAE